MLQELILILTQFGGGPGDPANNVVRFLLAAFFWLVLFLVSSLMWSTSTDRRHLYFSIAAAVGASRELFMFFAEYGSFRGYISFATIFLYYPPLEHAVAILSIILMGYAFLRFHFNLARLARIFLIYSSFLTIVCYIIVAPLWIQFLKATALTSLNSGLFIGSAFHDFPGDLIFRLLGAFVAILILGSFLYAKTESTKFPWLAFIAFFFFFMDDALQAANDLCNDRYAPVFAPLRHCLHIGAIALLVGVYWWEIIQQLKAKQKFLQSMLDSSPDMIFYKDAQGAYLGCNQNYAATVIGKPQNQIIGRTESDLILDPEMADFLNKTDQKVMDTKTSYFYEQARTLVDGRKVILETIKNPFLDNDGQIGGLIGISRDITARRQLEKQLRHSQKMESIGTLAGGIAHDFNNILSAIFGYTELAIRESADPKNLKEDLDQILVAARRAKELVQQILAFSRKTEQQKQPLRIALIVKEALKMLRSSIPTSIELRQNINSEGTVLADSSQIHQIIMNLCTNAYHAMQETGGILAVSLKEIELREGDDVYGELVPGRYLQFKVSDTGCGISPEIQGKIFEPYFTTKKTGKGTGLGLAVVHGIIKSYHGHIAVYSEQGQGTTFHIYLPLIEETVAEPPETEALTDLTGKNERILFVDDEVQIRESSDKLFSMYGYQVTTCMDGAQALEEFKNSPDQFDLVITDMTMPYMNGAELSQKILAIRPDMPIIICSGQSDLINKEKALAMGIYDYLNKPLIKHDLLTVIRKGLEKNNRRPLPE